MSESPKVIGEGTYGCVHKPSLTCKRRPDVSYVNKVSKILSKDDAKKELSEYKKVSNADKNSDFYLGKPDKCGFDEKVPGNLSAVLKCKIGNSVMQRLNSYELIVMGDGGLNIEEYSREVKKWLVTKTTKEHCEKFLLDALRLFMGLVVFEKNGIVHHDLKPQNIVYNEKTGRLNFIDFGLMETRKKLITDAEESRYEWSLFHWSFPWELELLNKATFGILSSSKTRIDRSYNRLVYKYKNEPNNDYSKSIGHFFKYCFDENTQDHSTTLENYFRDYEFTLKDDILTMQYDAFLKKSISTVDVFGLGISLKCWLKSARRLLEPAMALTLQVLFDRMISAKVSYRYSAVEALDAYENFITTSGLLVKYGKQIDEHIVINDTSPLKKTLKIKPPKKFRVDRAFVDADPNPCAEGSEWNPKTGRCNVVCKSGYERNAQFKCVKSALVDCPEGKVRNPKTGRCIKTIKIRTSEPCPEGKTRNPLTGRCKKNSTMKKK